MLTDFMIFFGSLIVVIKSATYATRYATQLAKSFRLSNYVVGLIVVAIISILPETFVAINAAIAGIPAFGLGVLFGSNIADLTLIFVVIILLTGRGIKIESKILKNISFYPFVLLLPIALGIDGYYSRWEGLLLIGAGLIFYYAAFKKSAAGHNEASAGDERYKVFIYLLFSLVALLAGAHFTVTAGSAVAHNLNINPILVGMIVVGLGTTVPELSFSFLSVKKHNDSLAVGDVLGTVLADATVVVGLLILVRPFSFPPKIIYITGLFMVAAAFILFYFMRTGRTLSRKESCLLLLFWVLFILVEFLANS